MATSEPIIRRIYDCYDECAMKGEYPRILLLPDIHKGGRVETQPPQEIDKGG